MAQSVGQDSLVLSHYDEYNLSNLKFALIGLAIILAGVFTWVSIEGHRCYWDKWEEMRDTDGDGNPDGAPIEHEGEICDTDMIYGWVAGIPIIIIGIILIIYWFRLTGIRKSAMLAEAEENYEEAISLVKKLKDYKVIPSLTQKRNVPSQPVQSPQVQQQYAQPQPTTTSSPQPSPNPTINVNIQNIQPDTGAKNIHIQDSVVNDSDLL
ncbi:MAG: hypothetical protein HN923_04305 [Euryarchaeota archaeon]|jgi:hypothetical protein|nr:hypothetical protein [Euryarchaeota archaeon]MBT7063899.1 hypothetical protein [Euryarchaeota archaeon]MBT7637693.1 hypothetical protein [Euryarchaeota archaeon]